MVASTSSPSQDSKRVADGKQIDYTPSSDVIAGDVVVVGTHPLPCVSDIASGVLGALEAQGIFDFACKDSTAFSAGDTAYWDANGESQADADGSTALSGCVTGVAGDGELLGMITQDVTSGDTWARVRVTNTEIVSTTVSGALTVDSLAAGDSSLGIDGLDATGAGNGGAIIIASGQAHTNGDGGVASVTAGEGSAAGTGDGGIASLVGGESAGGATGDGGDAVVTGGAAGSTAGDGGAASVTGGLGTTTDNGGAASLVGGISGATGTGGAAIVTSGAGDAGSAGTAGDVSIDCGDEDGGTAGNIGIGLANAGNTTIGSSLKYALDPDAGSDDAYTMALDPPITAYQAGQIFILKVATANTGACTVDVNGVGAKDIVTASDSAPANDDIITTSMAILVYNGTKMVLINPATTTD